jgi:hypothetical protein
MNHTVIDLSDDTLERLAAIEHDQWMEWAKNILTTENVSAERKARWEKLFVPYDQLSEEMKEFDRVWARKVIDALTGNHPANNTEEILYAALRNPVTRHWVD